MKIHTIDQNFRDQSQSIASFVLESTAGPILFESGPHSTLATTHAGIEAAGFKVADIKHVFLTHIHFDHAGAAWWYAKNTAATVYVHPRGYKHMHNPERLYGSAKRIYGDMMDVLWGKMEPIEESLLVSVEDGQHFKIGEHTIKALHTPGHAVHHIAWQIGDQIIAGDVAGCKIGQGIVVPPCPPPDINIEDWENSIRILREAKPKSLWLTHYGEVTNVDAHLDRLTWILHDWANFIKPYFEAGKSIEEITPHFLKYANQQLLDGGVPKADLPRYEAANPSFMSVAGLMRYWTKKTEAGA